MLHLSTDLLKLPASTLAPSQYYGLFIDVKFCNRDVASNVLNLGLN